MREKISRILKGQVTTSMIYILLGLCLICMPVDAVNILCRFIFGVVLIAAGLYHIWIYVQEKQNSTLMDLFSGGLILVLGIFLFYNPEVVVSLLPVLLGTFILTDSIWVLKGCVKMRKRDGQGLEWKILLAGSLIFIALGAVMIVNPFSAVKVMIVFAGAVLLANGIVDLVFLFLIRKGIKTLTEFRQRAKEKEEAAAAELREQEPVYAPWSSRNKREAENKQEENKQAEDTQGQENDESEGDDPSPIETGETGLSEKTAAEDAPTEKDDDEETDASARNMENYEAKRQEEPQEEHVIEE